MSKCQACGASLPLLGESYQDGYRAGMEAMQQKCAGIGDVMINEFMSDEYATGQPLSSFGERFACKQMSERIRALGTDRI